MRHVDLERRVALVHGLDPALQAVDAVVAGDLPGVVGQAGRVQAVKRIDAIPGDRRGEQHAAHQDDRHGAPEGQERAPEERSGGQRPRHQAAPAST
ncbi:hypothetical protein G6F46_015506 [Rhizopus delemar]|nr:hypothetical protein G6F46_015506 [Rhizopus delemar]